MLFSFLDGLEVSLFCELFFSLSAGGFSYGLHVCGGFWFDVFRLWVSLVVSTHSTDLICLLSFPGHWHGQGQRVLAGGIRRDSSWRFGVFIARRSQDMNVPRRPSGFGNKHS